MRALYQLLFSISGFCALLTCFYSNNSHAAALDIFGESQDTAVVNKLVKKAYDRYESAPDSAYFYGDQAIKLSRKINYQHGLVGGLLKTAEVSCLRGNYRLAKERYEEAIKICLSTKNTKSLSEAYRLYGNLKNMQADYPTALNYLNRSSAFAKAINDEEGLAETDNYFGIVYDNMGQSSTALDYYYKALLINLKHNNQLAAADNYNNIGVILQNTEVYPKALEYFQKAAVIWQQYHDLSGISTAEQNIGEILLAQKKYDEALAYLSRSLIISRQQKDREGLNYTYTAMGLCYAHKNEFYKALEHLDTAFSIVGKYRIEYNVANTLIAYTTVYNLQKKFTEAAGFAAQAMASANKLGNIGIKANVCLQWSEAMAGLKQFERAHQLLQQSVHLKDSLKNNESIQKLTSYSLELNFGAQQKQQKLLLEEKDLLYRNKIQTQRLFNFIFLIVIIGMMVICLVYYRQKMKQSAIINLLEERNTQILHQKIENDEKSEKLVQLNTLKDRLISVLAHDLRAPLSTLRGLFNLLTDDTITNEQFLEMVPQVLKKLEYTSDFLDTLLSWINSQVDDFNQATKEFNIYQLLDQEVKNLTDQATEKGITLINSVDHQANAVADPNSIRIVLHNLITNAIKFSVKNDRIEITASASGDHEITLTVKDTGIGMSPGLLAQLFKTKVTSSPGTHNEPGTGMGLLFCKDLVEKCNGKIKVSSIDGQGTEFYITLPAPRPPIGREQN